MLMIFTICDEHVDDVSGQTYTNTYTYIYIKFSDFPIWVVYVGLTSACPNSIDYMYFGTIIESKQLLLISK